MLRSWAFRSLLQRHQASIARTSFTRTGTCSFVNHLAGDADASSRRTTKLMMSTHLPPNLRIDPSSSFAPQTPTTYDNLPTRPASAASAAADGDGDTEERSNHLKEEEEDSEPEVDKPPPLAPQLPSIYAIPLPERLHVDIHTLFAPQHSSKVGTIWLDASVFGLEPVRTDLLKRAVDYYRAKKRGRRKAVTKTIAQVSGSANVGLFC